MAGKTVLAPANTAWELVTRYHRTATQQARDTVRDNAHRAAGLVPVRFTHAQVRYEPEYVERIVVAVTRRIQRG